MEITKPNDIFVATLNNPTASTYDLMTLELKPENTGLLTRDEYKQSKLVQDNFKTSDGKFDDIAFEEMYKTAASHYGEMADKEYLKSLNEVTYSPFDITRPKDAKTFKVDVEFGKDYNPFKQLYSRTGINTIEESNLSMRELAQQSKIYDTKTKEWSDKSVNDLGLLDKIFGDTLVYAQWDEDGVHKDPETGVTSKHVKGDWKINDDGNIFVETLGDREMYGKQIVNPKDILTTDGSFANNLDFFDNDNKESNAVKTTFRLAVELAPLLIPGVNTYYGGMKAAIGLTSVLPTFYKSLESMILGDSATAMGGLATSAENYMAKFTQSSISDEAQGSLFNYEQLGTMVADTFGQIYEQRAMAGLSKYFVKAKSAALTAKEVELGEMMNKGMISALSSGKIKNLDEAGDLIKAAQSKLPELESLQKLQSGIAKSLSLGYMAMTSTADIYGEALAAGYDKRTAGFSAMLAASGQYGIMVNNRMGDWFLDKSVGYTTETNKTMLRQAARGYMDEIKDGFSVFGKNQMAGKIKLASTAKSFKNSLEDLFLNGSILGENIMKNAFVEGIEEVTEQAVLDTTKGIVDTMSYLGMTKKKGDFKTIEKVFSAEGGQEYLANFIGGILGGAMFEINTSKIEPLFDKSKVSPDIKKSIYQYVANGHTDLLIEEVNKQRSKLGNNYLSPVEVKGMYQAAESGKSQADFIADSTISFIKNIDGRLNAKGLAKTDQEIIEKTMMDYLAIKTFENSKGAGQVGIEAILVDDFRNKSAEIMRVSDELESLEKTENPDQKELSALKDELKLYQNDIEEMITGKKAVDYFDQISFYFDKSISEAWLNIDRDTYVKTKYKQSFDSLKEKGTGITKERVNREWKEYLNNKDIRKSIEIATNAYKDYEAQLNPSIAKYVESGYSEEHKKTLENIIKSSATFNLYDVSDPATKKANISNWLQNAKEVEIKTGKRVIPTAVLATTFLDSFKDQGLIIGNDGVKISDEELDKKLIGPNNEETTGREFVNNILAAIIEKQPSTNFVYSIISQQFNDIISQHNAAINAQIGALEATQTEDNTLEIANKVKQLEESKINVTLGNYENTEVYSSLKESFLQKEGEKLEELKITKNSANYAIGNSAEIESNLQFLKDLKIEEVNFEDLPNTLVPIIAMQYNLNPETPSLIGELLNAYINNQDSTTLSNLKSEIKEFTESLKKLKEKTITYTNWVKAEEGKLKATSPEFFSDSGTNYAIPAIIKEIKSNKNLDKELFTMLKDMLGESLSVVRDIFKDYTFTTEELFDLQKNNEEYIEIINNAYDLEEGIDDEEDYVLKIQKSSLPEFLKDTLIYKNSEGVIDSLKSYSIGGDFIGDLFKLKEFVKSNKNNLKNTEELREILSNSEDFISNTLYDFIDKFSVTLESDGDKLRRSTIMQILKSEELSLYKVSDLSNYSSAGIRTKDMEQVVNTLDLIKTVITAMSTTEISLDASLNGFIAMRQKFAERNKLTSDATKLKTISSDTATMMLSDIGRIQTRLNFLIELSRFNSGKLFNEAEEIREKTVKLFIDEWRKLKDLSITYKGNPVIPDLSDILNSKESDEWKLLEIKDNFFKAHKDLSLEDKIELLDNIRENYPFISTYDSLYEKDGTNEITKEIKSLSNYDFFMSLTTSLVLNSKDIQLKLLNNLKGEFDKAPFYTQELAAEIAYASIISPKIFSSIIQKTASDDTHITDNITFILGNAGTGKTTVEYKLLLLMLQDNNPNLNVWFSAPSQDQASKLHKDVTDGITVDKFSIETFSKNKLYEELGIKEIVEDLNNPESKNITEVNGGKVYEISQEYLDGLEFKAINNSNLPDLILIDETTHFTAIELKILSEFSKRLYKNGDGKYLKIITAGDPAQRGAKYGGISYNVDRVSGIYTPQLNLTVRSSNNQKRVNNDLLSSLTKKSAQIFETTNDTPKIQAFLKDSTGNDGITLKYYMDENTLNGDYLTDGNSIPRTVLETLKNIITERPKTKIGILVDRDLSPELEGQLTKVGITSDNYKVYTPSNVQGSESDYFIFNLSAVQDNHIMSSIRNLNTYTTRAKNGTIIIKDELLPNTLDNSKISVLQEKEDYTEPVEPLDPKVIDEIKKSKIAHIEALLGDHTKILYDDFKFGEGPQIVEEPGENLVNIEIEDNDLEDSKYEGIPTPKSGEFLEDDSKIMLHTFYNDLNVSIKPSGDTVTITKNIEGLESGLSFLFIDEDSVTMSKKEFDEIVDEIVNIKYQVLNNYEKVSFKNTILANRGIFEGSTSFTSELVVKVTSYKEEFNNPFAKFLGDQKQYLRNGQKHPNLYLKIVTKGGKIPYYLHLATLGEISKVREKFGDSSETYNNYKAFLENDGETPVNKEFLSILTDTRKLRHTDKDGKAIKIPNINIEKLKSGESLGNSINDLKTKFPGIRFFNGRNFSSNPKIELFPSTFEEYKQLYVNSQFKDPISDDTLREWFKTDKGKPYLAISFIEDKKQVRFLKLMSPHRTIDQLMNLFRDPLGNNSGSISKILRSKDNKKNVEDVNNLADTMFSGSQVLDMLLNLAIDNPLLFNDFFKQGEAALTQLGKLAKDSSLSEKDLIGLFRKDFDESPDLISNIFYDNKKGVLREVLIKIKKTVATYSENPNASINKDALRKELLEFVAGGQAKYWSGHFWNILRASVELKTTAKDERFKAVLGEFSNTVDAMLNYWNTNTLPGIYYNVPIRGAKSGEVGQYRLKELDENYNSLYTTIIPEGPRMLVDLKEVFSGKIKKKVEETPEEKKVREDAEIAKKLENDLKVLQNKVSEHDANIASNLKNYKVYSNESIEDLTELLSYLDKLLEKPVIVDLQENLSRFMSLKSEGELSRFSEMINNFLTKKQGDEAFNTRDEILEKLDEDISIDTQQDPSIIALFNNAERKTMTLFEFLDFVKNNYESDEAFVEWLSKSEEFSNRFIETSFMNIMTKLLNLDPLAYNPFDCE